MPFAVSVRSLSPKTVNKKCAVERREVAMNNNISYCIRFRLKWHLWTHRSCRFCFEYSCHSNILFYLDVDIAPLTVNIKNRMLIYFQLDNLSSRKTIRFFMWIFVHFSKFDSNSETAFFFRPKKTNEFLRNWMNRFDLEPKKNWFNLVGTWKFTWTKNYPKITETYMLINGEKNAFFSLFRAAIRCFYFCEWRADE